MHPKGNERSSGQNPGKKAVQHDIFSLTLLENTGNTDIDGLGESEGFLGEWHKNEMDS